MYILIWQLIFQSGIYCPSFCWWKIIPLPSVFALTPPHFEGHWRDCLDLMAYTWRDHKEFVSLTKQHTTVFKGLILWVYNQCIFGHSLEIMPGDGNIGINRDTHTSKFSLWEPQSGLCIHLMMAKKSHGLGLKKHYTFHGGFSQC